MGFLKGAATFLRFKVNGPKPAAFGEDHLARLADHATPRIAAADGVEAGWGAGGHVLDRDFALAKNVFPDHLHWEFRAEADRLPADRLKAFYEIELKALAANNPSGFASGRQKREAREAARERLEQEAKDGRYRKTTLVPVVWDRAANEVLFGATAPTHVERFAALFGQTFTADLFQTGHFAGGLMALTAGVQSRLLAEHALARFLGEQAGMVADPTPAPFVPGGGTDVAWIADEASRDFLGNEFLLWLWFHTECESDAVKLADGSEAVVMVARYLALECPRGVTGREAFAHEGPTRLPEVKRAAQAGKLPRKAGLTVVRHDQQYEFALHAETFGVSGLKLPPPPEGVTDARAREEDRLGAVREFCETLDLLYAAFLSRRLTAAWAEDLARVQRWLAKPEARRGAA